LGLSGKRGKQGNDPEDCAENEVNLNASGVVWCGVVWCGVVWCGVVKILNRNMVSMV